MSKKTNEGRGGDMSYEAWQVQTFTGVGKKVLRVEPLLGPVLMVCQTSDGDGYTGVVGVDANGHDVWFAVNAIGQYSGTSLFHGQSPVVALKIDTDMGWSVGIRPLSEARLWNDSAITGIGNDVLQLPNETRGFATVALRTGGEGHSGIWAHGDSGSTLLFNAVGQVQEETVLPTDAWLISVESDSTWSMARTT
jgi:hypothetical protein